MVRGSGRAGEILSPRHSRRLAAYLLLCLLQCRQVALHFLQRFLQVRLNLRLLYRRQQLALNLLNVVLMKLELMLHEGAIEFRA